MSSERTVPPEKEVAHKNTIVIVEDSSACAYRHERRLSQSGMKVEIFRDLEQFLMFINNPKNAKKIQAVITDGLEGDWVGVAKATQEKQITNVWLISGNSEFVKKGKSMNGIKSISKGEIEQKPEIYQEIIE